MTREEYIQYRKTDTIMPVAYEAYKLGLKKGSREHNYRTFVHAFGQYLEIMRIQGQPPFFQNVWRYYDKKFHLIFLEKADKNGKVVERLGLLED